MAEFGWAYIGGGAIEQAKGVTGSVMLKQGEKEITGSSNLVFNTSSNTLLVGGDILVTDANANNDSSPTITLRSTDDGHINNGAALRFDRLGPIEKHENLGEIWWYGSNGDGSTYYPGAAIVVEADSTWSDGVDHSSRIKFATTAGTGDPDEKMVLDSSGNLGIGTMSPTHKLEVVGEASASNITAGTLTVAGFTSTGNSVITGSLTVSGSLYANELVTNVTNKSVVNISATGSTQFGDTTDDTHVFTGSVRISSSAHPLHISGLQAGDRLDANSYLALDASGRIILTSSITTTQNTQLQNSGGGSSGGELGAAEDGDYTDGLFTDFTTTTTVGTAVDRFNEVLKILAPSPAPSLRSARADETNGVAAKLSFGQFNTLSGYESVTLTSYTKQDNSLGSIFTGINQNSVFESDTSSEITDAKANVFGNGTHFKLGIYSNQEITGTLNYDVGPSSTGGYLAFASGAFGNAETGSLKLQLNGNVIHSVDLSTITGSGNPATGSDSYLNSSGSGFILMSVSASSFDGNGSEWHIFKHRTAGFKVSTADQASGSNTAIVYHEIGPTRNYTNAIIWVNDPDGPTQALGVNSERIEDISLVGSKYVSGVQYNTDLTANYKANIVNMYKNVFPSNSDTITFTPTNSTTPAPQSVLNIGGSEDNTKVLPITASVDYNSTYLLNGTIGMSLNATHPLKTNLSNAGSATITGMLIDADTSQPNSNLLETFEDEDFRISSGSYDSQNDLTSSNWDSTAHMTSSGLAGHEDGMLQYNRRLYNPRDADIPSNGNFTALANVSPGQPNYSGETNIRTYFRKIQNTSGSPKYDFKITSQKNMFKFNIDTVPFDSNDAHFLAKIPGKTGWMNISLPFEYGSVADGDGSYINGASSNSNRIGAANSVHVITFGTESVANNEHLLIKIESQGIAGYVEQLSFQLGASAEVPNAAPVLDDIDFNDSGTSAKLSFGSSNAVSGYSNVQGSGLGAMSTINSNGLFALSGDRRGVFTSQANRVGTLNEDVGGTTNYGADSFFNGYSGSLVLEVNGATVHTVNLASTRNALANNYNSNNSGFNLSAVSFSTTSDGVPSYVKPYRTGTYQVGVDDQVPGWNYARVLHGGVQTNYVEWVVDASGAVNNTSVSSPTLSNFGHTDFYYQSGIKYYASRPTASFDYVASNFYSNVYSNDSDAISFGTTNNCSVTNIRAVGTGITTYDAAVSQASMPPLNNSAGCETTSVEVTGTILFDNLVSISGGLGVFTKYDASVASTVKHPFKANRTTSTASKTAFMVYSGSIGSTNLNTDEYFNTEHYRIVSGNYANQSDITSSANAWNSQTAMNNGGSHDDGMVTANGFAISPFQIGVAGNTGHANLQAPPGNPDYSSLTNNTRTIYRYFRNNSGVLKQNGLSISFYGDAYLVAKSGPARTGTLGANKNIFVELKVSNDPIYTGGSDLSTGWMDVIKSWDDTENASVDGAGLAHGSVTQTVSPGSPSTINLEFQTKGIYNNQYFVVKISAHKDWIGYLSRIRMVY